MSDSPSFVDLMSGLRAGEDTAAFELVQRFSDRLMALARSRLDQRLKQRVDPEDVLQSVFGSFLGRVAQGQFDLKNWNDLAALLVQITMRKCYRQWNLHQAIRRDVRQESPQRQKPGPNDESFALVSLDPTPSQAAVLEETVTQLLTAFEGREREMLGLALQGYSAQEIGERVDRTERTVRRFLQMVRKKLERMAESDDELT